MTVLTRPPVPSPPGPPRQPVAPLRSPVSIGLLGAAQAATASLLCVLAPVVAIWMTATATHASAADAVRVGVDAWLLAHHGGIAVTGGQIGLLPWGLTLLAAWCCWDAGRRMGLALLAGGPRSPRSGRPALVAFTAGYAALAAVAALLADVPAARPILWQGVVGAGALAALTAGPALTRSLLAGGGRPAATDLADLARLPLLLRRALPAAVVALALWLAAGSLATVLALVTGRERVLATYAALEPGAVGGAGLTLAQLVLVPVAVVWGAAWVAGPGFAVGVGTSLTPAATTLGALPALPVLGALPEPGEQPWPAWLAVLLPVLAGAVAALWWLRAKADDPGGNRWRRHLPDVATVAALAGLGAGVLAWLASGPAGPGRLGQVGPEPVPVALAVAAQVLVGGLVTVLLRGRVRGPLRAVRAALAGAHWAVVAIPRRSLDSSSD